MATETKDELPESTAPVAEASAAPQVAICFLLISGRRNTMTFDFDMTIGRVKELIWNAWDDEWDATRPPAPSSLRLLYFGKLLQDGDTLRKLKFPSYTPSLTSDSNQPPVPSIVHVSIRPFDSTASGSDMKKKKRRRDSGPEGETTEQGSTCCCIVC